MKKTLVTLLIVSLWFLAGCKEDALAGDVNDANYVILWNEPKFEDRDPNKKLITFILTENDVNMVVELDIDPNGCLYIKTENCDMKEAARVVWKCCRTFWDE